MPLQNRITPFSMIEKTQTRGTFMGNRGILHDDRKKLTTTKWRHKAWIICMLKHKDWHRQVMAPNRYTELFFLDEATALAAGHRPCALCRREDYNAYRTTANHRDSAKALDAQLHQERVGPILQKSPYPAAALFDMPDGIMIIEKKSPARAWLYYRHHLYLWSHEGYQYRKKPDTQNVLIITPGTSVTALRNGYPIKTHPSMDNL